MHFNRFLMKTLLVFLLAFLCLALQAGFASGGPGETPKPEENVLRPNPLHLLVGPILGGGLNLHSGDFITQCECSYSNGAGPSYLGGVFVEYPTSGDWSFRGELTWQEFGADFSQTKSRVEYASNGEFVQLDFDQKAEVRMQYLQLNLLAKWATGFDRLYFTGGLGFGSLLSNQLVETETIATPGWVYVTNGSNLQKYLDGPIGSERGYRAGIILGIGYDFWFTPDLRLSPELAWNFPVTSIRTNDTDWRTSSLTLDILLGFGL